MMDESRLQKAAQRGEPSYVWRAGQERRLHMIQEAAGNRRQGLVLVDGCGVGAYLSKLAAEAKVVVGLDVEFDRLGNAQQMGKTVLCGVGEQLPFSEDTFDLILSHEVLEHVNDDRQVIAEAIRTLRPGGRLVLFCPNRGYPFETHGIYWRGSYRFGNIPMVNYLPRRWRDRLAPHVSVYSRRDLARLFNGLPVLVVSHTIIFGAYDNIITRWPRTGRLLRAAMQALERTPLRSFGLSHFWVVEKASANYRVHSS